MILQQLAQSISPIISPTWLEIYGPWGIITVLASIIVVLVKRIDTLIKESTEKNLNERKEIFVKEIKELEKNAVDRLNKIVNDFKDYKKDISNAKSTYLPVIDEKNKTIEELMKKKDEEMHALFEQVQDRYTEHLKTMERVLVAVETIKGFDDSMTTNLKVMEESFQKQLEISIKVIKHENEERHKLAIENYEKALKELKRGD